MPSWMFEPRFKAVEVESVSNDKATLDAPGFNLFWEPRLRFLCLPAYGPLPVPTSVALASVDQMIFPATPNLALAMQ